MLVVSLGDSLSAEPEGNTWVIRACRMAGAGARPGAVHAAPGYDAARIAGLLGGPLVERPDVCVVLAGANDVFHWRLVRPVVVVAYMLVRLRIAGITPVVCTVPPHDRLYVRAILARRWLNRCLRALARLLRLPLVDLARVLGDDYGWSPGLADDGLHPNEVGRARMAEELVPVLARLGEKRRERG